MATKLDDLSAWRFFVTYAKTGSLVQAAEILNLEPSSISRAITALEKSLGQELVVHNSRPMQLTVLGQKALERMEPILRSHRKLIESLTSDTAAMAGHVRLSVASGFATRRLVPFLTKFSDLYPNITIDVVTGFQESDIAKGRCDLGVITGRPKAPGLIYMSQGRNIYLPVATPAYIERFGMPLKPSDLMRHVVYMYSGPVRDETHELCRDEKRSSLLLDRSVKMANVMAIRSAVLAGQGVALDLPLVQIWEDLQAERLVPILPGWMREPEDCFVVTNRANWHIRRVRLFLEWYALQMQEEFAGYEKAVAGIVGLPHQAQIKPHEVFQTARR